MPQSVGMRLGWLPLCLLALGCRTQRVAAQGGAVFRDVTAESPSLPALALYSVCWPQEASPTERVLLTWLDDDVVFEAQLGASNSTGRCLREIATTYPFATRPTGTLRLGPPRQPLDGWAVLAWVKLLSASRFGPERGLLDPSPLVRACLQHGELRSITRFVVRHVPGPEIRVIPSVVSEAERCVEAVLGSTAWPSSRSVFFDFAKSAGAGSPGVEVGLYYAPASSLGRALDPAVVKESMLAIRPRVAQCWDAAVVRRTGLGGARTFRFRVDDSGAVTHAWVTQGGEALVAADYLLDRCLEGALGSMRLPPTSGDGVYTWIFAARE